jgi:GntR family transcriptional regulator
VPAINHGSPIPKYLQLRTILVELIEGELGPDDAIPSERELSERFGVSRMTVRETVDRLVAEGRLYRVPAKGTFVAHPKLDMPLQLSSFSDDMRRRGLRPGARELTRRTEPAREHVRAALDLGQGDVHVIERLRLADGTPMAIERTHVDASITPGLAGVSLEDASLYAVLADRYGIRLDGGEQWIEAAPADAEVAGRLGIGPRAPVLRIRRLARQGARPVEYTESVYRADRYQLHVALPAPA